METVDSKEVEVKEQEPPRCSDFDEDCVDVKDKVWCWLHAPECGECPYLK
jgi:hypothetical protein